MEIKTIGEITFNMKNKESKKIIIKIDMPNKLLYFFENNEKKEPSLALSLDLLVTGEINNVIVNSAK